MFMLGWKERGNVIIRERMEKTILKEEKLNRMKAKSQRKEKK